MIRKSHPEIKFILGETAAKQFYEFRESGGLKKETAARVLIAFSLTRIESASSNNRRWPSRSPLYLQNLDAYLTDIRGEKKPASDEIPRAVSLRINSMLSKRIDSLKNSLNTNYSKSVSRPELCSFLISVAIDPDVPWPNK